jgi:ubiquinone/menaquinone biosynthesis C-methylase UbiE
MKKEHEGKTYKQFYSTILGTHILKYETRFVDERVRGCNNILSIGCGPALLEERLHRLHPEMNIIGIDSSKEMVEHTSKEITIVQGDAQHLAFEDNSFEAVLFITSIEFIQNIHLALQETYRVLHSKGLLLVLLLNPNSGYFQEHYNNHSSYIRKHIKHTHINTIREVIAQYFIITHEEYFLGIINQGIVETENQAIASLFVLEGKRR